MSQPIVTAAPTTRFTHASRINHSLTAIWEKRALEWMALRAPRWVTSDRLTALGLGAQIAAGIAYALAGSMTYALLAVNLFIVLNWLGDSLDGTLARVRQQQRPRYGFYVDHIVDLMGATAMMMGLAFSGLAHWPVAAALLIGFLLLAGESYLATYTLGRFQLSQGLFGPTELRILLIAGNFALMHSRYASIFGQRWLLLDVGGIVAAAGMLAMLLLTAARHTRQLYREEPLSQA